MRGLPRRIMEHIEALPEATPLRPADLRYLGNRVAVAQALSRLARSDDLMRVCRGVYMRPIETRFGLRNPCTGKAIEALSNMWGVIIVPCGASAANCLNLTTQNPVRVVYLTSGPSRRLRFYKSVVELRHAPTWQLAAPYCKAGNLIRALSWLGPGEVEDSLDAALPTLSEADLNELAIAQATLPGWMAKPVRERLSHG